LCVPNPLFHWFFVPVQFILGAEFYWSGTTQVRMSEPELNSITSESRSPGSSTSESNSPAPTNVGKLFAASAWQRVFKERSDESQQRRTMLIALSLLLVTLGLVLYRDRDFWFSDTQEAESQTQESQTQSIPPTTAPSQQVTILKPHSTLQKKSHTSSNQPQLVPSTTSVTSATTSAPATDSALSAGDPPPATITRTVLPPLDVEVVAGDNHRTVRPGTNSIHVELQPDSSPQSSEPPATETSNSSTPVTPETTSNVASNAAERVQMSPATTDVVTQSVEPGYPLLARQMKVQGSVVLQALIGRDGLIQDLHILSGPPILANAAQEAVRQWHFKPHYEGSEAVETQARITVNFTISTN
jgi:TonB family protein